ncbi:MAG TPA: hypothetical protein VLL82_00455 [Mycobacterium sp.]|nr:hypothetical protein [Mycobacterium sp.]
MTGFEVLREVRRDNAKAWWAELDTEFDRLNPDRPGYREGLPVELWRALGP